MYVNFIQERGMSFMNDVHNNKHLTVEERIIIEKELKETDCKLIQLSKIIGKDPRTISKEIKRNRLFIDNQYRRIKLNGTSTCFQKPCERLLRFPYVCNGCRKNCTRDHYRYDGREAHEKYKQLLSSSREGYDLSLDEKNLLDSVVREGVTHGKSIYVITIENQDIINKSPKTIYNYIDAGILSTKNVDLRSKVKYKPRNKKYDYKKLRHDAECLNGRKYQDYIDFLCKNPCVPTVQLDTVEGSKESKKCFMTLHFVNYHFMMIFLLKEKTSDEVGKVFNWIQEQIGVEKFKEMFPLILTDRGTEFINPFLIEIDPENGGSRTKVFYCDAYVSSQKGSIESNHRKLRYIVPKGTNFDCYEEKHAVLMMNHIASYPLKELSGNTPYQIMEIVYGKETLNLLKVEKVDQSTVNLTTKLLMK